MPNLVRRIESWAFGEDTCVIELTLSGDHTGPYRGTPASGRKLDFRIIAHFTFDADGRIKQETAYYDALTFMRQLGLGRRD
ncbi:MAG: ester cyclase [Dehalococcoidia bacterium]